MQSGREDTLKERYAIKFCFKLGKNTTETFGMLQTAFGPCCMNRSSVFEWHRDSRKAGSLWGMMRVVGGVRKSINQSWLAKGLELGLLCWGLREFRKRFRRKRPTLFKSGQWHFQQDKASVHNSILVRLFNQYGHQDSSFTLSIVQTLLPVTFAYSLSSEAVIMRQVRRWKRL